MCASSLKALVEVVEIVGTRGSGTEFCDGPEDEDRGNPPLRRGFQWVLSDVLNGGPPIAIQDLPLSRALARSLRFFCWVVVADGL